MTVAPQIFREYDIRGLVGSELDADTARDVGRAFAVYLDSVNLHGPIAVGRDNRPSGDALRDALVAALTESGVDVVDVGVVPTPTLYWALERLGVAGGVQITASHNPAPYNGFKLCVGTNALYGDDIQKLLVIVEQGRRLTPSKPGSVRSEAILDPYLDDIVAHIGPLARPLSIALDCANGVGSLVGPKLMERLGVRVTQCILCTSDGNFPKRQPDPSQAKNLVDLQNAVRATSAQVGIAVDGDADRIGVIDEHGEIVWGDRVLAIYARDVLSRNPGKPIIFDVKCSEALPQAITAAGGKPFMWRTGHSLIEAKMHEVHAPLAGELSGHMYIADGWYGFDDALYSAARFLSIMASTGKTVTQLLDGIPVYPSTDEIRVDCPDDKKFDIVNRAIAHWRANHTVVDVDGARVLFDGGWGLIRASNTQPAIVCRFEAHTQDRLNEITSEMEGWLRQQGVTI
ncbi:MAG TPA: phosphomannomutase/phosphoglucomutase [Gemmatimonadaceae bacterium]|nr:phosphomannomutase/phosphoglucomutase [Gemmatimonadaceae bacterium]